MCRCRSGNDRRTTGSIGQAGSGGGEAGERRGLRKPPRGGRHRVPRTTAPDGVPCAVLSQTCGLSRVRPALLLTSCGTASVSSLSRGLSLVNSQIQRVISNPV